MDFRKMTEVMEKSWNFIFWSEYFVLFENWKHFKKHAQETLGFQHGKFKLVMGKSWKIELYFNSQLICEPSQRFSIPVVTV